MVSSGQEWLKDLAWMGVHSNSNLLTADELPGHWRNDGQWRNMPRTIDNEQRSECEEGDAQQPECSTA